MSISVIVPVLNEAEYLDTLLRQFRGEEVIVAVDRKTTDGSDAVAKEHGAKVVYCDGDLSAARNLGASYATGEWLLHTDADVIYWSWSPCRDIEAWLKEHPDTLAAAGRVKQVEENVHSLLREAIRTVIPVFFGHFHLIRKDVFEAVGGYSPRARCLFGWEDVDMAFKLLSKGIMIQQMPFTTVHRRKFNIRALDGTVLYRV